MIEEEEASKSAAAFVRRVSEAILPSFPHYAYAIRDQLDGRARITNDGWNRIAAILAALAGLPGETLTDIEHRRRGLALSAVTLAQAMAEVTFGGRGDLRQKIRFASWMMDDMERELRECREDERQEEEV